MSESFFRSRWVEPPAGVEQLDPAQLAPGFRAGGGPLRPQGGRQDRRRPARLRRRGGRLLGAAHPQRLGGGAGADLPRRVDRGAIRAAVVKPATPTPRPASRASPTPGRCAARPARASGLAPERVAVAETGVIGVPLPIDAVLDGDRRGRGGALGADGGMAFSEAIMTTDRWPKSCTVRAGGVTLSAQAKGAGMIEPGFATMLCFVQTDAVVEDPDAALRAAVDASFERITVDGQMSTNDTVLLQATGAAGAPLPGGPARRRPAAARDRDRPRRRGRRPGRPGRGHEAPPPPRRPSGSPARSPTRRWSRPRSSGATRTGAGSPRPPAWRSPARSCEEIGADRIDAAELGEEAPEAEIGLRLGRGEHRAHVWFSDLGYEYVRINAEYTT